MADDTTTKTDATDFDKLLGELEVMTKAMPKQHADGARKDPGGHLVEDREKAVAKDAEKEEGGEDREQGEVEDDDETENEKGQGKAVNKKRLAKSFTIKLEDGTEVEAEDGTELVKSLQSRLGEAEGRLASNEGFLAKAIQPIVNLLKAQAEQIEKLTAKVDGFGKQGVGRKAVVSIVEKPTEMAKAGEKRGMEPIEFLAKAETALKTGRITGSEIALAEACINRGTAVPPAIVSKVVSAG